MYKSKADRTEKGKSSTTMEISICCSVTDRMSTQKISKNREALHPNKAEGPLFSEAPLHSPKETVCRPIKRVWVCLKGLKSYNIRIPPGRKASSPGASGENWEGDRQRLFASIRSCAKPARDCESMRDCGGGITHRTRLLAVTVRNRRSYRSGFVPRFLAWVIGRIVIHFPIKKNRRQAPSILLFLQQKWLLHHPSFSSPALLHARPGE